MIVEKLPILGKTLVSVEQKGDESIAFVTTDGERYQMYHDQDCCESVDIEDVCGDLDDLVGSPLLMAEEVQYEGNVTPGECVAPELSDYSFTWTFYKFATVKGYVTIRWFGTSNGYYSESVTFKKTGE